MLTLYQELSQELRLTWWQNRHDSSCEDIVGKAGQLKDSKGWCSLWHKQDTSEGTDVRDTPPNKWGGGLRWVLRLSVRKPSSGEKDTQWWLSDHLDHSFLPITQGYWAFCLLLLKLHCPMYLYHLGKIYLYRSSLHVKWILPTAETQSILTRSGYKHPRRQTGGFMHLSELRY